VAAVTHATALIALDAVVIDTETTGLDPATARVLEIGAVRLVGGRLDTGESFRSLVKPDVPIPAEVTVVHGIDAAKVADAPGFAQVWPEFSAFLGNAVVIGHTVGFDLALLQRETQRIGVTWKTPRALDTRLLAQVVAPDLAGHTLEKLAEWLGVQLRTRHSALGDAETAARIFQALVPKLREGGIRTFAEAWQACRALTDALEAQHRAGWAATDEPARIDAERTLSRIDSYPYRHRVRDLMSAPPLVIEAQVTLQNALRRMMQDRISSLFVRTSAGGDGLGATEAGIITERDILRAVAEHGTNALASPVSSFMSRPLMVVPSDAFVYRAIGRMNRLKIRHLGVTDAAGNVVGALSARDLLRLRAEEAVSLGDEIDQAHDVHALAAAWAKLPHIAGALLAEELSGRDVAAVISRELGALTRQAAVLAEKCMRADGYGEPPCRYAVAVLGSGGRGESLLAMDQDNALIFAAGEPGGPEDSWFERFGTHLADYLHEAGVPYCKGGVMAKNAAWRGSLETWQKRIARWIDRSNPQDLLNVDIFFDMRGVHGDGAMAEKLWRFGFDSAQGNAGFAKLLGEAAGVSESGLTWFGRIKTTNGRIDVKKAALFAIVTAARALAIRYHVVERSTPARLAGLRALAIGGDSDLSAMDEAQGILLDLLARQQVDDVETGTPPSNKIAAGRLSPRDRERLRTALASVRDLDHFLRDLLFKDTK
jgi:CBS domain-containing protein